MFKKKELAEKTDVSAMAVTHYENGDRRPDISIIKLMAKVLNVKVADFSNTRNQNLVFAHGEFRKESRLCGHQQEHICENVEEYTACIRSLMAKNCGKVRLPQGELERVQS